MVATMAEKQERKQRAEPELRKVNIGVRIAPTLRARLEEIAAEISRERYPASISASELAAVAIAEYVERYDKRRK